MIISTGVATPEDYELALKVYMEVNNQDITSPEMYFGLSGSFGKGEFAYCSRYEATVWSKGGCFGSFHD